MVDRGEIEAAVRRATPSVAALVFEPLAVDAPHAVILMPRLPEQYAARLYAALREADELAPGVILIEHPPASGTVWEAVADRLSRAAGPR